MPGMSLEEDSHFVGVNDVQRSPIIFQAYDDLSVMRS